MSQVSGPRRGDYHQAIERLFNEGTVSGLSEVQLLERFAARNDEAAFAALVERHGPMVLGVCRRFLRDPNDVDDAFQAVFLVLVRRAGDIRRKELLGNWLHGVACRVAIRARALAARRPATITEADGQRITEAGPEADEGRSWLHEEVERLPRRYRQPVVACYFEGRTHEEAATLLGCPLGTVKGRLSRARDLLRKRLERRGLTVPAVALAARLASPDLRAAVPVPLAHGTVRAGVALATAGASLMTTTSAISTSVRILTQGALHAMVVTQIKTVAIPMIVVAGGLLTAGATVAARQDAKGKPTAEQNVVDQAAPEAEKPKAPDGVKSVEAVPDADIEFLHRIEGWGQRYSQLRERLNSDLRGVRAGPASENAHKLHGARIKVIIRNIEQEAPASRAGRDLKTAFSRFLSRELDPKAAAEDQRFVKTTFHGFGEIGRLYQDSLSKLNADLRTLKTPEEQAVAGELHRARLDALAGSNDGGVVDPWRDLTSAYLAFRLLADADPKNPRSGSQGGALELAFPDDGVSLPVSSVEAAKPPTLSIPAPSDPPTVEQAPPPQIAEGGGFGGGEGGGTDEPSSEQYRLWIARGAAVLARVDESPLNKSVLKALEKPITLRSDEYPTLGQMLKQIKNSVKTEEGKKIAIYVDPVALQEADKSLDEAVVIDLEDVPLKFSLRLMLKQLGLAYCVRDGVIIISSLEGVQQELMEAQAEQMGLNPDKFPVLGGAGGMMGGMGGGFGGMGGGQGMM